MSAPAVPSVRRITADNIAAFICDHHLAQVFGGEVGKEGRYYGVGLSILRYLDGEVRIYGPRFIQVLLRGPLVHGEHRAVYTSEDDAIDFLRLLLVEHDEDAAYAIKTKS